jgi:hypothetical protein
MVDSAPLATDLEQILPHEYRQNISVAESRLLRAAGKGEWAVCGESSDDKDKDNNPLTADGDSSSAHGWGVQRSIRAGILRWLCTDPQAATKVHSRGLSIYGAKIVEPLDLYQVTVPFPIQLSRCRVDEDCDLGQVKLPLLLLSGSAIGSLEASGADIRGTVWLDGGFSSQGGVDFYGAKIGGDLNCNAGKFHREGGLALDARQTDVGGTVFLDGGFSAIGGVNLYGSHIRGDLNCNGSSFKGRKDSALFAESAEVQGFVFLGNGFFADGEVDLVGIHIGSDLNCNGGRFLNPAGAAINASQAEIKGGFVSTKGFSAVGAVNLYGAHIGGDLECRQGKFTCSHYFALDASRIEIKGTVFLNETFSADGGVSLYGAQISGDLVCSDATLKGSKQAALNADNAQIAGSVFLHQALVSNGEVTFVGAHIGGDLNCGGGQFTSSNRPALNADHIQVTGYVNLDDKFKATGSVILSSARIGRNLNCEGGSFTSTDGESLQADGAEIGGSVLLRHSFSARGKVDLLAAHIGGDLECENGTFENGDGEALNAERAEIGKAVFLRERFSADGEVNFQGIHIGSGLDCNNGRFSNLKLYEASIKETFFWNQIRGNPVLDLADASVRDFSADKPSWPSKGNLYLDGFVYGGISADLLKDAEWRLKWLDLPQTFSAQPYRQLAKALRELGDDEGARQVLFALEDRKRGRNYKEPGETRKRWDRIADVPSQWLQNGSDRLSEVTIGYGIYPENAVWELCGLALVGWIVFRRAELAKTMVPTDKDAYDALRKNGTLPDNYPPFNPLIYSLENCVPLIKLGQDERWQADPKPVSRILSPAPVGCKWAKLKHMFTKDLPFLLTSPVTLRWFRWVMIILGWGLATFFVAGLTGSIKTN